MTFPEFPENAEFPESAEFPDDEEFLDKPKLCVFIWVKRVVRAIRVSGQLVTTARLSWPPEKAIAEPFLVPGEATLVARKASESPGLAGDTAPAC